MDDRQIVNSTSIRSSLAVWPSATMADRFKLDWFAHAYARPEVRACTRLVQLAGRRRDQCSGRAPKPHVGVSGGLRWQCHSRQDSDCSDPRSLCGVSDAYRRTQSVAGFDDASADDWFCACSHVYAMDTRVRRSFKYLEG